MTRSRGALLAGLHIVGLSAVVLAQPLFDLLGANPEFFIAHDAGRLELLAVVAGVVLLLPAVAVAIVWLAWLASPRLGAAARDGVVGALVVLFALQALKRLGLENAAALLPLAALAGAAAAAAYHRFAAARSFATVLSLAIIVVPAALLARPEYRRLIAPRAAGPSVAAARARPVPVVMIVLDETPVASLVDGKGRIDPDFYPNFAALARDGIWYRHATTVSDYTRWALPAIVTGELPRPEAAPTAADHPHSLFNLLSATHRVEGLEAVTRLCPDSVCGAAVESRGERLASIARDLWIVYQHIFLPEDMKAGLPKLTGDWANFGAAGEGRQRRRSALERTRSEKRLAGGDNLRNRAEVAHRFVERITAEAPQPRFYFFHTMLPHTPHVLLPTGQMNGTRATPKVLELSRALPGKYSDPWTDDEWVLAVQYQRHLLQLAYFDSIVGDLVKRLKEQGLYDRALLLLLSDHGTSYRPNLPRRDYTEAAAADLARIIFLAKFPAGTPPPAGPIARIDGQAVSDRNVETIDVVPTVADLLGITLPWKAAGVSLLDHAAPERQAKVLYYDFAKRTKTFDRLGPDITPVVQRRLALFGGPENPYRVPRPPQFPELIGKPLPELRVGGDGGAAEVDYLSDFQAMDVTADPVPFDVAGRLDGRGRGAAPACVAVAVNGTVRAVTRTWLHDPAGWLATPPLSAYRNGANDLQVFVVDQDAAGPHLRRCAIRQGKKH